MDSVQGTPLGSTEWTSDTEQDKANPDSQAPSPLPGGPADQALSGQWLRTGGGSGLPLSHTEEEGPLANMEKDRENNTDPELSQWGDGTGQELCLSGEMTVQEFEQRQEEATIQDDSPCGAVKHQEWHQWEVGVRVQWGDGTQQELPMDRWVHPEEDEDAQSCAQQGPASPSSVGTQVAGDTAHELPSASPALGSPTEDGPAPAAAAAAAAGAGEEVEEPPEPVAPEPEPGPVGVQALSEQQEEAHRASVPAEEESKEGALPEELQHTQCKYEEYAELSQGETNKHQEGSQGEACIGQELSREESGSYHEEPQGEACIGQELSPAQSSSCHQGAQGEACIEQKLSPLETSNYNKGSQGEACIGQELSLEQSDSYHEEPQGEACIGQEQSPAQSSSCHQGAQGEACIEQELPLEEASSYHLLSDWDEGMDEELSLSDAGSRHEVSDWEEYTEQDLSQGQVGSSHSLSDWEGYSQHELSHGDDSTYQDVSDWEESLDQDPSQEEDTLAQEVNRETGKRPSPLSSWENDSHQDLVQDSWEQSIGTKALLPEDDEWDDVSVLELLEDEDREPRLAALAGGGFPVPVPREAWVEHGAAQPCPRWPPYASPPRVEAPAPRGSMASRAFQEQVPEAGSLSQQRAPRKKRLSRLRRALRALRSLFRFPCLAPQPQD
ncbi:hypothetical protein DUI87_23837 [Hirundo rustica rustica]|uniref:Uncharacterized protein n=1 Tax=Hirundo rustica rustica TaxID=333673 RepID=A0A3M0JFI9_HIRRU|nr:hypothetical protein DUI87_23837 [Hirundo rustica rustica]